MLQVIDRGYKDHLDRVITGKMPIANMGDKGKYFLDYEVFFGFNASFNLSLSITAGSLTWELNGANWSDFGVSSGDTIYFVDLVEITNSTPLTATLTVDLVNGNQIVVSGGSAPTTSQTYVGGLVYVIKSPQAVKSNFNLIPRDIDASLGSAIDGTTLTVVNNSIGAMALNDVLPLSLIGDISGGGIVSATIKRLTDTRGGNAKSYRIEFEFYWHLFLSNYGDLFFAEDCETPYVFTSFMPIWNNPSIALSVGFKPIGDGNSGFRNENFNQNPSNFKVNYTKWANANGVIPAFDYSAPTEFEIEIESLTGNGFGNFAGLIFFNDIKDSDVYSANPNNNNGAYSHLQHTTFAETSSINTVVPTSYSFDSYIGKDGEKLTIEIFNAITTGQKLTVNGKITPNQAFTDKFNDENNDERQFVLLARVESASFVATNYSDTVNLVAWIGDTEIAPIPDEPYNGAKDVGFLNHSQGVTETTVPNLDACTEDDFMFKALMDIDENVRWESMRLVVEVERISDGLSFNLESHTLNFANVNMFNGQMQFNEVINIQQFLEAPERNKIQFKNTGVVSSGKYEALLTWSIMINWRYWLSKSNALNTFFNVNLPNNGLSQEWVRYLQEIGYRINVKAVLVKDSIGYFMGGQLRIQDYDESIDIVSTFDYFDENNNPINALISGQLMKVRAVHTLNSGTWDIATLWGWIGQRGFESNPSKRISTVWNQTNISLPLRPLAGETKAKLTLASPSVLHVEALVDTNQINVNKATFISRIQTPKLEPSGCMHPFTVFFERLNSMYDGGGDIIPSIEYLLLPFITGVATDDKKRYNTNMCCADCLTTFTDDYGDYKAFAFGGANVVDDYSLAACCYNSYPTASTNECSSISRFLLSIDVLKSIVDYSSNPTFFEDNGAMIINEFSGKNSLNVLATELINFTSDPLTRFEILMYFVNNGFVAKCYTDGKKDISIKTDAPPNFDVTADWSLTKNNVGAIAPVTDENSFRQFLTDGANGINDLTNIQIGNFSLVSGRLTCYLEADGTVLYLGDLSIVKSKAFGKIIGLEEITIANNFNVDFNLNYNLPKSLIKLDLNYNQMTLAGYTASEPWANNLPVFTNPCTMQFSVNPDSILGTNLYTILLTKNVIIIP